MSTLLLDIFITGYILNKYITIGYILNEYITIGYIYHWICCQQVHYFLNKLHKDEKHQTRVSLSLELISDAYLTANRTCDKR